MGKERIKPNYCRRVLRLPGFVQDEESHASIKWMVTTRQAASLQLSRTPWTPRRKRKIWRARRFNFARGSTGCSEPWSKKLRQPCDDGYC
jgi:hypothetical protein